MSLVMDIVREYVSEKTGHAFYQLSDGGVERKILQHIHNDRTHRVGHALCKKPIIDKDGWMIRSSWHIDEPAPFDWYDSYEMVWCQGCTYAART